MSGGAPVGNQNAAKGKMFEGALKRALARNDGSLNKIADELVSKAITGEQWAVQMVADRLDGKAKQQIVGGDEDDNPLRFVARIERIIVDPQNPA